MEIEGEKKSMDFPQWIRKKCEKATSADASK